MYAEYHAFAYSKDTPLWIVDKGGSDLCKSDVTLQDAWSDMHKDIEFPKKFPEDYCRSVGSVAARR